MKLLGLLASGWLAVMLVSPLSAQPSQRKSIELFCDTDCRVNLEAFTVAMGQTAAQFQFSFETSWKGVSGVGRVEAIVFGLRGTMGETIYECTEYFDKRPAREVPGPISGITLGPGTYTVYLVSGPNSWVTLDYALGPGGVVPAEAAPAKPVVVSRDAECNLYPGGFRVEPGCTAMGFHFTLDTPWEFCSGTEHVEETTFIIKGEDGELYEYRVYYDRRASEEKRGPISNLTLGPGNYVLLLNSGKNSTVALNYFTSCGTAAGPAAPGK